LNGKGSSKTILHNTSRNERERLILAVNVT